MGEWRDAPDSEMEVATSKRILGVRRRRVGDHRACRICLPCRATKALQTLRAGAAAAGGAAPAEQGPHQLAAYVPDIATTGETCAVHVTWGRRSDLQSAPVHLDLPAAGRDFMELEAEPALGVTQTFKFQLTLTAMTFFSRPVRFTSQPDPQEARGDACCDMPSFAIARQPRSRRTSTARRVPPTKLAWASTSKARMTCSSSKRQLPAGRLAGDCRHALRGHRRVLALDLPHAAGPGHARRRRAQEQQDTSTKPQR